MLKIFSVDAGVLVPIRSGHFGVIVYSVVSEVESPKSTVNAPVSVVVWDSIQFLVSTIVSFV